MVKGSGPGAKDFHRSFFVFGVAQGSKERIALMELHFYFISFVDAPQLYLYSYLELYFFYLYFQRQMPHLYFS